MKKTIDAIGAALDQALIAESLAEHYKSFGDIESAEQAQKESTRLLEIAYELSSPEYNFDIDEE